MEHNLRIASVPALSDVIIHSTTKRLGISGCFPASTSSETAHVLHVFGGVKRTTPAPAAGLYLFRILAGVEAVSESGLHTLQARDKSAYPLQ
jgi:hypothetical protein